jgi:hypothetical protein
MKTRPVGAEFFHADSPTGGQTDMTKIAVTFCNFSNVPKNTHFDFIIMHYLNSKDQYSPTVNFKKHKNM